MSQNVAQDMKAKVRGLYGTNLRQGRDPDTGIQYRYLCPSPGAYPWQWFWDSCFHAIALCHVEPEHAKEELRTLVAQQEPDGFIGHVTHWGRRKLLHVWSYLQSKASFRPRHTALIQPPVLAQAVERVAQVTGDGAFVREMLPSLDRFYGWLAANRDPDGDGLISIISPYESGLDHKPSYDRILGVRKAGRVRIAVRDRLLDLHNLVLGRNYHLPTIFRLGRFDVEDVLVNAVYADALAALARLHHDYGTPDRAAHYQAQAERTTKALLEKCWDPERGAFFDLYGCPERQSPSPTVTIFLPLILDGIPRSYVEALVGQHLERRDQFWLPYPVPSVAATEPAFAPDSASLLWRGPTWINTNWFIWRGLRRYGYGEMAAHLRDRSAELVEREGFREFYNPYTGQGMGARDFGWSSLVLDMLMDGGS